MKNPKGFWNSFSTCEDVGYDEEMAHKDIACAAYALGLADQDERLRAALEKYGERMDWGSVPTDSGRYIWCGNQENEPWTLAQEALKNGR